MISECCVFNISPAPGRGTCVKLAHCHERWGSVDGLGPFSPFLSYTLRMFKLSLELVVILDVSVSSPASSPFCLLASHRTWSGLQQCWSAEMFLPGLTHRLWRLTLQLLARYSGFVHEVRASHAAAPEPLLSGIPVLQGPVVTRD